MSTALDTVLYSIEKGSRPIRNFRHLDSAHYIPVDTFPRKNQFVQPNILLVPTGDVPQQRTTATTSTEILPVGPVISVDVLYFVYVVDRIQKLIGRVCRSILGDDRSSLGRNHSLILAGPVKRTNHQ